MRTKAHAARRPERTRWVSRLVREEFPGTIPQRSRRLQTCRMYAVAVLATTVVDVLVGVLVLVRSAQRRIGWLLIAQGVSFGALLVNPSTSTSHAGMVADQLGAGSWVFLFLWLVLIAYLVPDGHSLSPGWRRWMLCGLAGVAAFLVGSAGDVEGFRDTHTAGIRH